MVTLYLALSPCNNVKLTGIALAGPGVVENLSSLWWMVEANAKSVGK